MSFRIEKKYLIHSNQLLEVRKWLSDNKFKKLFSGRKIESIYFENYQNDMFLNSEEGCVPRKKIRLRSYPGNEKKFLEIKTSSAEGRFKSVQKYDKEQIHKLLSSGHIDSSYGICKSKLKVNFYRNYLKFDNYRITLDKNIQYSKINNSSSLYKDNYHVLEIKTATTSNYDFIDKLPFQETRFSKYCRGFKYLFT